MALQQHAFPGNYNRVMFWSPQLDAVDPTIPFLPLLDPATVGAVLTGMILMAPMRPPARRTD